MLAGLELPYEVPIYLLNSRRAKNVDHQESRRQKQNVIRGEYRKTDARLQNFRLVSYSSVLEFLY